MSRRARIFLLLVFGFAAAAGIRAVFEWQASPYGASPLLDEEEYIRWARRIAAGDWRGEGVFYQDPLWPYLLAIFLRVANGSLVAARLAQVGLALGTLGLTFLLARRLFGGRQALLAAALLALCGVHAYYQAILLKATLAAFLATLSFWLAARAEQDRRWRDFLFLGAALGAFSLVRGNGLALVPIALAAAVVLAPPGRTRGLEGALALLAGVALALAPAALHNRLAGGEWILTTAQAGPNFYIGNSPYASGTYAAVPFVRAGPQWEAQDFRAEAERRAGRALSAGEVSRLFLREGTRWISAHPAGAARLWLKKAWLLLASYEVPDNESFACMKKWFMPSLRLGLSSWGLMLGPALVGLALSVRARRGLLVALFTVLYGATLVLFFVVSRYRFPLFPAVAVYAAHGAVSLVDLLRAGRWRPAVLGGAAALAASAASHAPSPAARAESAFLAHCAQTSGALLLSAGEPARATPLLEEATRLEPGVSDHQFNLALALQRQGDPAGAETHYREALRLSPGDRDARLNLGLLLIALDRCGEAKALTDRGEPRLLSLALQKRCGPR